MLKKSEGFEGAKGRIFPTRQKAAEDWLRQRMFETVFNHRNDKIMDDGKPMMLDRRVAIEAAVYTAILIQLFPADIEAVIHAYYEDLKETDNSSPAEGGPANGAKAND